MICALKKEVQHFVGFCTETFHPCMNEYFDAFLSDDSIFLVHDCIFFIRIVCCDLEILLLFRAAFEFKASNEIIMKLFFLLPLTRNMRYCNLQAKNSPDKKFMY